MTDAELEQAALERIAESIDRFLGALPDSWESARRHNEIVVKFAEIVDGRKLPPEVVSLMLAEALTRLKESES